jgi:Tfp pilus assembly protein PilF
MHRMRTIGDLAAMALVACAALGCGSTSTEVVRSREASAAAANEGMQAFAARDYATAAAKLSAAIEGGGLNADSYSTAAVRLAVAYAQQGQFAEAEALLTKLEQGAPNVDEVLAARSLVFKKQGKLAESRAALAQARRLNRFVKEFK